MAIPGPGTAISMTTIATEFGGTVPHSLSEYYRGGGLVPNSPINAAVPTSGQIAIGDFYGATNRVAIPLTLSTNSFNYDVYTNRGPTYSAGISDITVTVNPGITVGSTSAPTYSLLVPSAFNPGDTVTIINNGLIQAMGGAGGRGGNYPAGPGSPGSVGGNAVYINRPTTITNNGTIAGGGGGGGGGAHFVGAKGQQPAAGGGGGGGAGTNGGAGGAAGSVVPGVQSASAGSPGTSPAGGGGGPAPRGNNGGAGGGRGAAGSAGVTDGPRPGGSGGGAGNYIVGNPFVTWPATGTRQGGVA